MDVWFFDVSKYFMFVNNCFDKCFINEEKCVIVFCVFFFDCGFFVWLILCG